MNLNLHHNLNMQAFIEKVIVISMFVAVGA